MRKHDLLIVINQFGNISIWIHNAGPQCVYQLWRHSSQIILRHFTQNHKCQPRGVGTGKVNIWKPWMSLRQSVRCFDISQHKWGWQKSSGFNLWATWISMLKFTAVPSISVEIFHLSEQNVWPIVVPEEKAGSTNLGGFIMKGPQTVKVIHGFFFFLFECLTKGLPLPSPGYYRHVVLEPQPHSVSGSACSQND